jgi:hypothetical protein
MVARAFGAFAFSLQGVETQSVNGNDVFGQIYQGKIRQGSIDDAAGGWEQRGPLTKKCRYNAGGAKSVELVISMNSCVKKMDKAEPEVAVSPMKNHTVDIWHQPGDWS